MKSANTTVNRYKSATVSDFDIRISNFLDGPPRMTKSSCVNHPWLAPLPLAAGKRSLPDRILPGPMEGITAGTFARLMTARRLVRAWVTPFIRISTAVPRAQCLRGKLSDFAALAIATERGGIPVVVQLMGTDIKLLAGTAERIAALEGVVGVDLNCACPSKFVLRHGGGGARLADPGWIRDALIALRKACPDIGVSVKLRTGLNDADSELPGILAAVREARPDFVMLHYRTVAEGFRPVADGWSRLARARDLLPDIPLFASGDIFTPADAETLRRRAAVDGVTPARGLLRNPWLLEDIRNVCDGRAVLQRTMADKAEFLRCFCVDSLEAEDFRNGCVMELARHLFGAQSAAFLSLTKVKAPQELIQLLTSLPSLDE